MSGTGQDRRGGWEPELSTTCRYCIDRHSGKKKTLAAHPGRKSRRSQGRLAPMHSQFGAPLRRRPFQPAGATTSRTCRDLNLHSLRRTTPTPGPLSRTTGPRTSRSEQQRRARGGLERVCSARRTTGRAETCSTSVCLTNQSIEYRSLKVFWTSKTTKMKRDVTGEGIV
jgi:hypothetical protein